MNQLGKEEQQEFLLYIRDLELRTSRQRFTEVTQYCFENCVTKFTSKDVEAQERKCVESCVDKYAQAWDRCARRWAEIMSTPKN